MARSIPAVPDHRRQRHCDQHGRTFGAVNDVTHRSAIEVPVSINPVDSDPAGATAKGSLGLLKLRARSVREWTENSGISWCRTVSTFCRRTRTSSQMSSLAGSHPSIPQVSGSNPEGRTERPMFRPIETVRARHIAEYEGCDNHVAGSDRFHLVIASPWDDRPDEA